MFDFENAGAAPVEAADARYLSLGRIRRRLGSGDSPPRRHEFAEAERFDPGGLDRRADCS